MDNTTTPQPPEIQVEDVLRDELSHGDTVISTLAPILGHLVSSPANSLFSDEIIAQVRGMADSVSGQLLRAEANAAQAGDVESFIVARSDALSAEILRNEDFLTHFHALTIERQFAERLEARNAIDLVLSPLLQALIASDNDQTASTAMAALAAQARFMQQQRRMDMPLNELPGDLYHTAIQTWRAQVPNSGDTICARAEGDLRSSYDEASSRHGLLTRLVTGMGSGVRAALSVHHAGSAIFLTALSVASGQSRNFAAFSTTEGQVGRLALGLRVGGLKPSEIEEQFLLIHPEIALPEGFEMLRSDTAASLLATSATGAAG